MQNSSECTDTNQTRIITYMYLWSWKKNLLKYGGNYNSVTPDEQTRTYWVVFFLRKLFPEKRIMYNAFVWGIERNLWTQNYGNGHLRETVYRKSMQLLRRKVFMIIELFSKNWLKDEFETEYKSFQIVIFLYKKGSERYFASFTKA